MLYRVLADGVVLIHLGFVAFVVLGGIAALRWPRVAWVHLPCAAWGAWISFAGWICPLTPLENRLRVAADADAYGGGFVEHYLLPLLYPGAMTRTVQIALGAGVLAVNAVAYAIVLRRRRRSFRN